jgi:arylsulfatase A-like enzyme
MIVRWPGQIKAGQTNELPWAAWDLMATFADLAGVQPPSHTDGISVVPTLLGRPEEQEKREYLYWEYQHGKQQAVRMGPWKGVRLGGTQEPIALYYLREDIGETNDVASVYPEVVLRMRGIMEEAREGSPYTKYWPLPERLRDDIRLDVTLYERLEEGDSY